MARIWAEATMERRELAGPEASEREDDEAAEIRYSLTALGEAVLAERRGRLFRGFGPCAMAAVA
jgi:hypothetical protein